MRWVLGLAFLAFAAWALIPDTLDEAEKNTPKHGAFLTTLVMFFLAEMGDKTQLATVALGAQFNNLLAVTMGTTLGMMIANVPAVLLGETLAKRFPLSKMRFVAAALFAIFGALILLKVNLGLGLVACNRSRSSPEYRHRHRTSGHPLSPKRLRSCSRAADPPPIRNRAIIQLPRRPHHGAVGLDDFSPQPLLIANESIDFGPLSAMPRCEQIRFIAHHERRVAGSHQRFRIRRRLAAMPTPTAALVRLRRPTRTDSR